jgi:hypothetical protein
VRSVAVVLTSLLLVMVAVAQQQAPPGAIAPGAENTAQPNARVTYQISGTVVNSVTGAPVKGARLVMQNAAARQQLRETRASDTGQFAFNGVAQGKYAVAMSARGFQQQAFEQHEGYSSAIAVGPGKRSTGLVFRAQPEARIAGVVTGAFSEPVTEGQVYLFRDAVENGTRITRLYQTAQLDESGEYHFKHLPAGRFYLAVASKPWFAQYANMGMPLTGQVDQATEAILNANHELLDVAYPVTYFGDTTEAMSSTVVVTRPGVTVTANVNLTPVRATHITVNTGGADQPAPSGDGVPQPSFGYSLHQKMLGGFELPVNIQYAGPNNGVTDLRGIAPGHYTVAVHDYAEGTDHARRREVDVSGDGAEVDTANADGGPRATVSGTLVLENGAVMPPQNGSVLLVEMGNRHRYEAKLGPKGEFSFAQKIEQGTYQVFVMNVPFYVLRGVSAKGAQVLGRELTVGEDTGDVKVTISASRGVGLVNGTAMTGNVPTAGAMIVLVPENLLQNAFEVRRDQSDSDGTFTLAQVVPGRYTVLALKNGWEMEWNNPEVLRGFLARGTPVVVEEKSKQEIKVEVQ